MDAFERVRISQSDITSEGIVTLISKIQKAGKRHPLVVLDFKGVQAINSGGIGVLIRSHKDLQLEKGGIVIVEVCDTLRSICANSGLDRMIPIYQTYNDYVTAVKNLESKREVPE